MDLSSVKQLVLNRTCNNYTVVVFEPCHSKGLKNESWEKLVDPRFIHYSGLKQLLEIIRQHLERSKPLKSMVYLFIDLDWITQDGYNRKTKQIENESETECNGETRVELSILQTLFPDNLRVIISKLFPSPSATTTTTTSSD